MSINTLYPILQSQLKAQNIGVTAAELHGFISGILAGGNQDQSWQVLLNDMINDGQAIESTLFKKITELYEQTKQQLNSDDFDFELLLNQEHLFNQIDDLVGWINHFLLGLGLVQPQLSHVKGDVGDAIYDLRQITQLGYEEDEDQEQLAFAFEEILEYVRMTAILCHDEFRPQDTNQTLH